VNLYQRPAFVRAMKRRPAARQEEIRQRARRVAQVIGDPHAHSGLGIRPFGRYFEFRVGLQIRCLFLLEGGDMHLVMVGSHDELSTYIRNNG
jgi:hypothetical protein